MAIISLYKCRVTKCDVCNEILSQKVYLRRHCILIYKNKVTNTMLREFRKIPAARNLSDLVFAYFLIPV
jgi:hypothetical protein